MKMFGSPAKMCPLGPAAALDGPGCGEGVSLSLQGEWSGEGAVPLSRKFF